ncbi:type II secretion system F family protein [Spirillospora albida]|uniref:type II secretion system F family protein n=1 Tax=Spirillospora albida TaxID=58123 RepID=UPI00068E399A|nr:type II secretion system F family protein [Spirillospora albida]
MLLLAGLAALYGGIALALLAGRRSRRVPERRLASLRHVYGPPEPAAEPEAEPFGDRVLAPLAARLGRIGRRLTPAGLIARLHRSLALAGNPPSWTVERVMQAKGAALGAGVLLGVLFGAGLGGPVAFVLCVALGASGGFLLPDLLIHNLGTRRQLEIAKTLPDVLDMLTIGVEAGLGFDAAMAQVRQNAEGPLAGEFARVLQEMRIGLPRADALRAMAGRTTVAELRGFATAVVQAGELGIPIAGVLREQAREMRLRRRQRAEEAAQKVPIKILFPLLLCLFPALFVIIIGPGALRIVQLFGT